MTKPKTQQSRWRNRIVGEAEIAPDQLLANPLNWRIHPHEQELALRGVLDEVGWVQRVIVNKNTGHVVDGHLRVATAISQNAPTVPVLYVDLTEEEEKKILLTIDPLSAMAVMDDEKFKELVSEVEFACADAMKSVEAAADAAGVEMGETATEADAEPQIDRAAELNKKWQVKTGDLWRIGEHRLLCGDSTKREDVQRVMGGEKAQMMVTDPPYGVEYDPTWRAEAGVNKNKGKMGTVRNDDVADWSSSWKLFEGDVAYVYHAGRMASTAQASLECSGFTIRAQIVWAKDRMALSRGDYHWQHEPAWYAVREGKPAQRTDDRTQTTLWTIPARDDNGHGTQKPLECMARPIRNHTFEIVYDPFLGSGTTMVACENLGRKCRGIEISPDYCAVILERMQTAFPKLEIERITT